ncbi:MAG: hypothetical protein RLN60_02915 [Phycisphaerales bacterium]
MPALPFVILRHVYDDEPEKDHFDFLFETEEGFDENARTLVAFRSLALDDDGFMFTAERLENHRRLYLDYEGPISGGRGRVLRIRSGTAFLRDAGVTLAVWYRFDDDPDMETRYAVACHANDDRWLFWHPDPS